ncbi:MAG: glycosyltransferase family 2 protein [Prevotella sp.]|nr:glycosyltransferase family 2 protein [Prevotella sp.]
MKTVSILVPVYNVEKFIQRCVESIFGQTYEQLDIVFVDDCSPDNSIQVVRETLERYPNRKDQVRILKHEKNRGLAAARNTAVWEAKGDYLIHVDSDDYIDIDTISRCVDRIEECNGADVVVFGVNHVFTNKTVTPPLKIPGSKSEYVELLLSRKVRFNIWGCMFKTDLYKKFNISAIEGVNMGEDYSVMPRLMYYANKIVELPIPLYNYIHLNENSYTNGFSVSGVYSHMKIFPMLRDFFSEKQDDDYMTAIDCGESMFKSTALLKWALYDNEMEYLDLVNDHFRTTFDGVPLSRRIILRIAHNPSLLKAYCRSGFKLKQFLK